MPSASPGPTAAADGPAGASPGWQPGTPALPGLHLGLRAGAPGQLPVPGAACSPHSRERPSAGAWGAAASPVLPRGRWQERLCGHLGPAGGHSLSGGWRSPRVSSALGGCWDTGRPGGVGAAATSGLGRSRCSSLGPGCLRFLLRRWHPAWVELPRVSRCPRGATLMAQRWGQFLGATGAGPDQPAAQRQQGSFSMSEGNPLPPEVCGAAAQQDTPKQVWGLAPGWAAAEPGAGRGAEQVVRAASMRGLALAGDAERE